MYKPRNTQLSADSYAILNAIRNQVGGEFRANTPLVEDAESTKAYGLYVTGSGDARNAFMNSLINRIAQVMCLVRSYQNNLKEFKKGLLGPGEMVENVWVGLVMPEGYTQSPVNPGDVYKTNNPENQVTFHPVNSKLVYEITTNDAELSLAFTSESGVYDLVSRIVQRLTDSAEWDEYILTKYVLARAALGNEGSVKTVNALTAANSDAIITDMKGVSNDMRFMNTGYNMAGVATHTPIEDQIFFLTAKSSAVIDVNSLASAYNLTYKQFIGQQQMINNFSFTDAELERLDHIMNETKAQGLIPNYIPFTTEELEELGHIVGATIDRDFFMIFDKLYQMNSIFDQKHLNTNTFLHAWKVLSYNPFANCVFFKEPAGEAPEVSVYSGTLTDLGNKATTDLMDNVTIVDGVATGTLKYVTGWTEFSGDVAEQSGNYIALKVEDADTNDIYCRVVGGNGRVVKLDSDGIFVARVTSSSTSIDFTCDGVTTSIGLQGLTLASA